jgi:hypothetical protein
MAWGAPLPAVSEGVLDGIAAKRSGDVTGSGWPHVSEGCSMAWRRSPSMGHVYTWLAEEDDDGAG